MSGNNEGFAARWSRRKREVQEGEIQAKQLEPELESLDSDLESDLPKELTEEEKLEELNKLTDEDMPDVETLDEESDYSGFMSTGVSEGLRKVALAKLFHGKSYNIRDGLDEYDGDYTFFEKLDPNTITSDMHHMIEVEAKRALAKKEQEELEEKEQARLLAEAEDIESFDEVDEFDEFADELEEDDMELASDSTIDKEVEEERLVNTTEEVSLVNKTNEINNNDNSNNEEVA